MALGGVSLKGDLIPSGRESGETRLEILGVLMLRHPEVLKSGDDGAELVGEA